MGFRKVWFWLALISLFAALTLHFFTGNSGYKDSATTTSTPDCANWREVRDFNLVNSVRKYYGLRPYGWQNCYQIRWARWHSRNMANSQSIYHSNPPLPTTWMAWGQNVGVGTSVYGVHRAFMGSAPHRANILDHDFRRIAPGIVYVNGLVWVTEDFITP